MALEVLDRVTNQRRVSTLNLIIAAFMMVMAETIAIHRLWFDRGSHSYGLKAYFLPVFIAFPLAFGFSLRRGMKKWTAEGELSSAVAAKIDSALNLMIMLIYLCINTLAELAF